MPEFGESVQNSLNHVFKIHKCEFVYLTGSYVRKEQFSWSDIDFVISYPSYQDLAPNDKLDYLFKITSAISEVLSFDNIDLKIIETLPIHIQFSMVRDGKLIYQISEKKRTEFVENLLNVYYDHAIWYENYLDMTLSGEN